MCNLEECGIETNWKEIKQNEAKTLNVAIKSSRQLESSHHDMGMKILLNYIFSIDYWFDLDWSSRHASDTWQYHFQRWKVCHWACSSHMFKVNNRKMRARCDKNTRMMPLVSFWCFFIVNVKHILHLVLVFL